MKPPTPFKIASPIMFGYFPIAMTFGLLAAQHHLSLLEALAFSMLVYAGAAQFASLGLLAEGNASFIQFFI